VYFFKDARGDGGDGGVVLDGDNPFWLAARYGAILFIDSSVEVVVLALEAVFVGAGAADVALIAAAGSVQRGGQGRQQEKGEVGLDAVADGLVKGEDALGAEAAAGALVGLGGVGVAVAEDDGAVGESGQDDLVEALGAVGEHEGHFSFGGDGAELGLAARVKQDGADAVAESGAAGLAEGDDTAAVGFERTGEALQLGGFARPVEAFEGDEQSPAHVPQFTSRRGKRPAAGRRLAASPDAISCIVKRRAW
jgi:hypothetical protein